MGESATAVPSDFCSMLADSEDGPVGQTHLRAARAIGENPDEPNHTATVIRTPNGYLAIVHVEPDTKDAHQAMMAMSIFWSQMSGDCVQADRAAIVGFGVEGLSIVYSDEGEAVDFEYQPTGE